LPEGKLKNKDPITEVEYEVTKLKTTFLKKLEMALVTDATLILPTKNEYLPDKKVVVKPKDAFNHEQVHPKIIYQGRLLT